MLEILAIIAVGNVAKNKGYTFLYGLVAVFAAWAFAFLAVVMGAMVFRRLSDGGMYSLIILGYFGGFGSVAFYVSNLPNKLYGELGDDGTTECPDCGSLQTERSGDVVNCFACGQLSDV